LALLLSARVFAQSALTAQGVNLRAGPDPVFPLVTWLPRQTAVQVAGCLEGGQWCDVVVGRSRGWVDSRNLSNFFRDRAPVVTFSVEAYWDEHYRRRPWYADKSKWIGWGTPSFQPPPPSNRRR
jgi:uncharacterized protein YraI